MEHCKIKTCGSFNLFTVPDDVFAQNYIWKGSYNFKGRKQPMTLAVTSFNASSGRVNATLSNNHMELLLSGIALKAATQTGSLRLSILPWFPPFHWLLCCETFLLFVFNAIKLIQIKMLGVLDLRMTMFAQIKIFEVRKLNFLKNNFMQLEPA